MSIKLTDAQQAMLIAASLRDDRCLALPKGLRGSAAQKVFGKLSAEGLVKEAITKVDWPVWRRDEEARRSYSLKLTAAGFKAASIDGNNSRFTASADDKLTFSRVAEDPMIATAVAAPVVASARTANSPREGTKIANVVSLLQRKEGATLIEMISATGWLPHTTRAALTGLRNRGYAVGIDRSDKGRGSIYRVAGDAKSGMSEADVQTAAPDKVVSAPVRRSKRAGAAAASNARKAA